jgi:uncharacterized membrane protein YdjX (TVP38/TMEM64 family)
MRKILFLLLATLVISLLVLLPPGTLSLATLQKYHAQLSLWHAERPLQVMGAFFIGYFLISALSIPGTRIMTLMGGALFGLIEGTVLVATAAASGATVAMLLSRYLLHDWVQRRFAARMAKINESIKNNITQCLFALRLVPVLPFSIINLLMGLTSISALRFAVITLLGLLPSIVLYISTGRQLSQIESLRDIISPAMLLLFALIGLLPLVSHWLIKRARLKN